MLDDGLNQIQFSCIVSDSFVTNFGDNIQFATGSDFSYLKLFKGLVFNRFSVFDNQIFEKSFEISLEKSFYSFLCYKERNL